MPVPRRNGLRPVPASELGEEIIMKRRLLGSLTLILLAAFGSVRADKVHVVASMLDMADFATQIGGEHVDVTPILKGRYDPHMYEPRPGEVLALRRADLLIVSGMELDAFMPGMIDAARNPNIRFGAPGFVDPSLGIEALDVPEGRITGDMGDVHPFGNPHYWYSEEHVARVCEAITEGLSRVDPENRSAYQANRDAYLDRVHETFGRLRKQMEPHRGVPVIQYHASWDYVCRTFGLDLVGMVETKPGIPPTPGHLAGLVERIRETGARLILAEPYYPRKPMELLEEQTGIQPLILPLFLGGPPGFEDYLDNLSYIVERIDKALSGQGSE